MSHAVGRPRVRRLIRALEYPLDLLRFLALTKRSDLVLHFQWASVPTLDVWAWRYLKRAGHPLIYTAHNVLPHGAQQPSRAFQDLYAIPHRVIVHTPLMAQELRARFPSTSSRIRVIPCGTLFDDVPEMPRDAARSALGLRPDSRIALFWGLIEPYKGLECMIRAFSQVARRVRDARLLIVGKPNVPVAPYRALIEHLDLSGRVDTRFEFVPTEQAPKYFGAADVVVLPYLEASQSGVLLTAYRFGRAVIVTKTGGLPDTVEPNRNGLIVPPGDEDALADAMTETLSDPKKIAEMGERSRQLGAERFNWRDIARDTIAVYREIRKE